MRDMKAKKQILRKRVLTLRDKLSEEDRFTNSEAIFQSIFSLESYRQAKTLLGYLNFGSEPVAEIFVRQALADGKRVLLPRVNRVEKILDLHEIVNLQSDITTGIWGIREPDAERCNKVQALGEIDFVLLPGVAFTESGERLGYGGGFYDRLLAQLPHHPPLVVGAFACQVVQEIPQEVTDQKFDCLVTEFRTIRCNGRPG